MISEFRRARRRKAADTIAVTDAMTDQVVGRIGNISETGMLLIANVPLVEDALYQLQFSLPNGEAAETPLEIGVHLLWTDRANAPGQSWTGFRFISISEEQSDQLRQWIEAPGSQYE